MPWTALLIALVFFVGVCVLIYPLAAPWFTQYAQSQRIADLTDEVAELGPAVRAEAVQRALDYNAALTGGASVAAGERIPLADGALGPAGFEYSEMLAADRTGLMGRIKIPAIAVDLPIYHGTSDDVLEQGVGHLEGTALPVGGPSTHAVLTGHRGLAGAELFTHLDQVELGDSFTLEVFGEVLTYRVISTRVVEPTETETLYPQQGDDLVTLVTCTPLGINSHRILVTGERELPTPIEDVRNAGATPDIPGFPWWILLLVAAVVLLSLYVWWSGRPLRRRDDSSAPGAPESPRMSDTPAG